ncbi:MAG: hypothetical protein K2N03_06920 [Muribaculaceae bacterium]|nr:hypothetical protein [Muribaculaceae bacterium]
MTKRKLYILLLLILTVFSFSLNAQSENDWKKIVADLNAQTPIPMGIVGNITMITFNNNCIEYYVDLDPQTATMLKLGDNQNSVFTEQIQSQYFMNPFTKVFFDILIQHRINLKYNLILNNKPITEFSIPYSELKKITLKKPDYKELAIMQAEKTKQTLPIKMGPMVIYSVAIDNDTVSFFIEIDEQQSDMGVMMELGGDVMKENILESLRNYTEPVMTQELLLYANAGFNIKYIYIGNITKRSVEFSLSPKEILESIDFANKRLKKSYE